MGYRSSRFIFKLSKVSVIRPGSDYQCEIYPTFGTLKINNIFKKRSWKSYIPVGKIAKKPICRSVFLTISHCVLSAKLTNTNSFRLFFGRFCPLGYSGTRR